MCSGLKTGIPFMRIHVEYKAKAKVVLLRNNSLTANRRTV